MSTPRQISKILNLANLETNTITASIDSDIVNQTVTLGVTLPVGTISVSSADTLPLSNIQIGQQGFVTSTNRLYIYNGSGWYNIATINSTPYWVTEANASYTLNTDGTATVVEINAADSDGTTVSYTATGDSDFNLIATVVQDSDGRFVIRSIDSDGSVSKTSASGTLTFTATDGVDQASTVSTFSITFGPDWSGSVTETRITAIANLNASDRFGKASGLSSDGKYLIVGAPGEDSASVGGSSGSGSADSGMISIFNESGGTWSLQQRLKYSGNSYYGFGQSASLNSDGTYAIIGADLDSNYAGTAHIYTRSGSTWTHQQQITGSDTVNGNQYGAGFVSLNSDATYAVVAGKYHQTSGLTNAGALYVFTRSGSTWTQQQKITVSSPEVNHQLGADGQMSSDGNYIIASGTGDSSYSGAAFVFNRSGSTWSQQAKLVSTDLDANDSFGNSASINSDGTYAVVGCSGEDGGVGSPLAQAGAAYVFTRSGSTWTQQAKLVASVQNAGDYFGRAVKISNDGNFIFVSASRDGTNQGAGYLFSRSGSTWTQIKKLTPATRVNNMYLGEWNNLGISNDGSIVSIGAHNETVNSESGAGAMYVFNPS